MSYRTNKNFGSNVPVLSPIFNTFNTTLTSSFTGGEDAIDQGKTSKLYRDFISDHCSTGKWGDVCQLAVTQESQPFPYYKGDYEDINYKGMLSNDLILKSIVEKKYVTAVNETCTINVSKYNINVAGSPYSASYNGNCRQLYGVEATNIDNDKVMNILLQKPDVCPHVLVGIYITVRNNGTLSKFSGTKLGDFFETEKFHIYLNKLKNSK